MGEIGIHLEDEPIAVGNGPLESIDVGRSQTQLTGPLQHVHAALMCGLHGLHDGRCTIRGIIIHDKDIEIGLEPEDMRQDILDVLLLVVGGDDDQSLVQGAKLRSPKIAARPGADQCRRVTCPKRSTRAPEKMSLATIQT